MRLNNKISIKGNTLTIFKEGMFNPMKGGANLGAIAKKIYDELQLMGSYDSSDRQLLIKQAGLSGNDAATVSDMLFDMDADERYDDMSRYDEAIKQYLEEGEDEIDYDDMDRSNDDAYEKAFSSMNEAKTYTPSSQEVNVKSKSTKTAKEVEVKYDKKYDNTDTKKADNVIFDQLIRGVQFEMENSKNTDKTVEEIKNIVLKNLTKDPIWYTKNAMFGVKDLGYTNDIPGYRPSKSDQMVPVSKDKIKANVKDGKTENKKGMPKKVDQMTSTSKSSKGVQKMATPGKPKTIKPKN
jgi:hypothetical protein